MLYKTPLFFLLLFVISFSLVVSSVSAQDGFDEDDEIVVFLKKIRDEDNNYLRQVTKSTAKAISASGEFIAKPYKRGSQGPVVEISTIQISLQKHEDGMSTKELTSAGLSLLSEVGSMFGRDEEASKVDDINNRMNDNESILSNWGENEQVMVTITSKVVLKDSKDGTEIFQNIKLEKVFDSKKEFVAQKESIIEKAIVSKVKSVLVEYVEGSGF